MPTLLSLNIATLLGFRLFIFRHYILYNTCIKINLKGLKTRLWGTVIHFVVPRRPSSYLYLSWITNFLMHTVKPIQLSSLIWLNDPIEMIYKTNIKQKWIYCTPDCNIRIRFSKSYQLTNMHVLQHANLQCKSADYY